MDFLPAAFEAFGRFEQFIIYKLINSTTRPGKTDKIPVDYRDRSLYANAHDPATRTNAETAIRIAGEMGSEYGVGFVFTKSDPFWFLDIDECLLPTHEWSPLACELLGALPGAAYEVSSSQRGLHLFGCGTIPAHRTRSAHTPGIEFYTSDRFVALTGIHAGGDASIDLTDAVARVVEKYFAGESSGALEKTDDWNDYPVESYTCAETDEQLLERALRSKSAGSVFGAPKASFSDLWTRNVEVLAKAYPADKAHQEFNESNADAALAQHLAFWTGGNHERILRLMQQSALVREKWERSGYLRLTIQTACRRSSRYYSDQPAQSVTPKTTSAQTIDGTTYLTVEQQKVHFQGCVYVCDEHKILMPGGHMLNPERFRVMYGGYVFPMDNANQRTSRNAFEAFTESQVLRHPRAHSSCFKPNVAPGEIVTIDGKDYVNFYWPVQTRRVVGDPTPFLNHIAKVCPDPRDQEILLSFLAACVQFKGVKFNWCPLIQGVEGNGKTLFTRCVAKSIGRHHVHFPKAAEIASKFNDWLYGRIFIGIEDIYVHDGRMEIMEALKPIIDREDMEIEPKGGTKVTRDICANFLINTNHKDGLRKTRNDRRFAPFYTAQQSLADLSRDNMLEEYFPTLYHWLDYEDGYAIVNELLNTYEIPDKYNPATSCRRAPQTSSTESAIEHGLGGVELEIVEAVEQGEIGFRNGWVSSTYLNSLLVRMGATRRIPQSKRRELMQSLGYDWHAGLNQGRVNNPVLPDGNKPRLYIKIGHKHSGLLSCGEIAQAYTEAQESS